MFGLNCPNEFDEWHNGNFVVRYKDGFVRKTVFVRLVIYRDFNFQTIAPALAVAQSLARFRPNLGSSSLPLLSFVRLLHPFV